MSASFSALCIGQTCAHVRHPAGRCNSFAVAASSRPSIIAQKSSRRRTAAIVRRSPFIACSYCNRSMQQQMMSGHILHCLLNSTPHRRHAGKHHGTLSSNCATLTRKTDHTIPVVVLLQGQGNSLRAGWHAEGWGGRYYWLHYTVQMQVLLCEPCTSCYHAPLQRIPAVKTRTFNAEAVASAKLLPVCLDTTKAYA